ncbi:MFS transporter [Amnibacterium kyonggiense]|uniref:Putative MFS family arabinose efflux permease n=1 Tax=Amnibacterium kyonggiense TaxID=595671 RepID=A0A4R7FPP9_9MICO|nr:MFS transporter [Amnibacterium kyonggiense]TDS79731.1 putative MFS family arabinose efflux permease [Amnibacterium kyonggiense]
MSDRRGWVAVLSVALGSFVLVLSEFLPIGLLPAIAADLRIGVGTAGLMVVVTALTGAIGAPVVTVFTSRVDRRTVLWSLVALLVVADVLGAIAPTFGVLLASRMLLGLCIGGFWALGAGIAGRLVRESAVIRATSLITGGVSVATVVSLPLGALVSAVATWRLAFVIGAALGVVALALQLVLLPRIPSQQRVRFGTLGELLRVPRARIGLIATALAFIAQFSAYTYVAPYLEDLVRVSPTVVTIALLAFGVAGIAGNFVAGVTLSRSVTGTLAVTKVVLALAVVALPLLAWSLPGVLVLLVVWGFVWGALPLGLQTWMSRAAPSASDGSLALFVSTIQIAISLGSVVGGVGVGRFGIAFDFFLAGGIAIAALVVLLSLGRRRITVRAASPTPEPC